VSVGYFAGQHITAIYNAITKYSLYAAIIAVIAIAVWIALRVRKQRRGKSAETGVDEPGQGSLRS
jgi:membrane protein DedA with SNARE-associated domain